MKSEAFSMKKPKVTRTSVGGPEIVKTLHDISDLLKVSISAALRENQFRVPDPVQHKPGCTTMEMTRDLNFRLRK